VRHGMGESRSAIAGGEKFLASLCGHVSMVCLRPPVADLSHL
jgi:hypothetical protein